MTANGLFRPPTAPLPRAGLTSAQVGEVSRLEARYGRCHTVRRPDASVLVEAIGDAPLEGEKPLRVVLDVAGRVTHASGGTRRMPRSPVIQPKDNDGDGLYRPAGHIT